MLVFVGCQVGCVQSSPHIFCTLTGRHMTTSTGPAGSFLIRDQASRRLFPVILTPSISRTSSPGKTLSTGPPERHKGFFSWAAITSRVQSEELKLIQTQGYINDESNMWLHFSPWKIFCTVRGLFSRLDPTPPSRLKPRSLSFFSKRTHISSPTSRQKSKTDTF